MAKLRRAASFPPQFQAAFAHVVQTGKPLIINNLGAERAPYTTLRARLHEFRRAFRTEAAGNPALVTISDQYDAIAVKEPVQVQGQWQVELSPREHHFGKALSELLSPAAAETNPQQASQQAEHPLTGAKAISELFDEGKDEEDEAE